ncbi:MAG TPA: YcaO-like family protein [Gaiellaceae bacterium]|nr:YcaO-like family protein [Gaiellaceae bacterium]
MPPRLLDRPATPTAVALRRLDALVSPYVGIVRSVEEVLGEPADIRLHNLCCETGHLPPLVGHGGKQIGAGSGRTRAAARAAAIAEAVERYAACASDEVAAAVDCAATLGDDAVAPARFALHSRGQYAQAGFPYAPFDDSTAVAWVEGFRLPDGDAALLPAQLAYLSWSLRPGEARVASATSSGLACHVSAEEATLSGLLEVLERDAFMLTWKARLSWPRLTWSGSHPLAQFDRRYVRPTGLRVGAIDLSPVWEVPCVLGVARSDVPGEAPLGVGAAAAATVAHAAEKALDEAVRVRTWATALRAADPAAAALPPPDEIRDFEEHIHHYAYEENLAACAFLDGSEQRRDAASVPSLEGDTPLQRIEALCDRLHRRGLSAYAVDVTSADVREAGLRVVKVLVPELCALDVEHAARYLGGTRLYEEPFRLGFYDAPLTERDLNPDPHPFP